MAALVTLRANALSPHGYESENIQAMAQVQQGSDTVQEMTAGASYKTHLGMGSQVVSLEFTLNGIE